MGIRRRVQQMQSHANYTMSNANQLIDLAEAMVQEIQDGVTIKFVRIGEHSIMDFVTGQVDELPIGVRVEIDENGQDSD